MNISKNLAQNIVNSIKDVLKQEINFIDTNGIIIASTDKNRVGTLHEGAKIVLNTKREVFIKKDNQYKGAKKGINVPVYFDNNIIGIIGLTGEEEVRQYAEILKKMTEILIKEAYLKDISFQRREVHRLAIDSLLLSPRMQDNSIEFDFSSPFQVIVGSFSEQETFNSEKISLLLQLLEKEFSYHSDTLFTVNNHYAIIVINKVSKEETIALLKRIQTNANTSFKLPLNFGIGLPSQSQNELKQSFNHAKQATEWLDYQNLSQEIAFFEDLDLGILLPSLPEERKTFFAKRVLGNIPEDDLELFYTTLESFSKNNGSIQKSADELFIHKNTFQYRLNKISQLTGFNPRNYNDFAVLKIAFLLNSAPL